MAKETIEVTKISDDRDGTELPEDTRGTYLAFRDRAWTVYLSEKNLRALETTIEEFTARAEKIQSKGQAPIRKRTLRTYGLAPDEVRAWGVSEGLAKTSGRLSQKVYDAYQEAH